MEQIKNFKNQIEALEKLVISDITKTQTFRDYKDIEGFNNKLTEMNVYINELLKQNDNEENQKEDEEIQTQAGNIESDNESDNESESESDNETNLNNNNNYKEETDGKDKYYWSVKNKLPNSKEKTVLYEAELLRKNKKTHEEFEEEKKEQQKMIDEYEKICEKDNGKYMTVSKAIEKGLNVINENDKYYFICGYEKKNGKTIKEHIIVKEFTKSHYDTVYLDYPYYQRYTSYYSHTNNPNAEKKHFERYQMRGKNKGEELKYRFCKFYEKYLTSDYTDRM